MTNKELITYGKDYLHDLETACCKIEDMHLAFVRNAIKALEQEPKTGHWIIDEEKIKGKKRTGNACYVCSECGHVDVHSKRTKVPYCWHCGARMVDPQESEG